MPPEAGIALVDELLERLAAMRDPDTSVEVALRVGPDRSSVVVGIPVTGIHLVVGRAETDVIVDHPFVSRRHVELWCHDGRLLLADAGSRNGTWVLRDGQRLSAAEPIEVFQADAIVTVEDVPLFTIGGAEPA